MAYVYHRKFIYMLAKTVGVIMATAVLLFAGPLLEECLSRQPSTSTASNKELVNKAFADWKQGQGTPFDLRRRMPRGQ